MRIEHMAIWTQDLERLLGFYKDVFQAEAGPKYQNAAKGFESYFLRLPGGGARIELMQQKGRRRAAMEGAGYAHLAISVGTEEIVDDLTARLRAAGVPVVDGPRWTGDGCYESVVLDPDGNRIEITV